MLATLVSLDPIYLDFDMSESDFLTYSKYREHLKGAHVQKVEVALGDDKQYTRKGVFDFLDNVLDRSSGTIHARATVPNSDLVLTPGQFALVRVVCRDSFTDTPRPGQPQCCLTNRNTRL